MVDAMRSPTPGRELAAPGRDGRVVPMLDASVPLSRREAHARCRPLVARQWAEAARTRQIAHPTREIVASTI